jgi:SAM-dependent methyltransferase
MSTTPQPTPRSPSLLRWWLSPSIYLYGSPLRILEFNALAGMTRIDRRHTLLDLGCGRGKQSACLARKAARVIGVDPDPYVIGQARTEAETFRKRLPLEYIASTLDQARLPDNTFDRIFSFSVLEHVDRVSDLLRECLRVLKPGGEFLFTVDSLETVGDALREQHRAGHKIVRYFRRESLRDELAAAGFADIVVKPILRSAYALRLFTRGVANHFRFGRVQSVLQYVALAAADAASCRDAGLFLAARCRKQP